jgi:hypothetical protein
MRHLCETQGGVLTNIIIRAKATDASARAGRSTKNETRGTNLELRARKCNGDRCVKVARNFPDIDQSM